MGMGISTIGLMKNMPAVIFAIIIGTAIIMSAFNIAASAGASLTF